MIDHKGYKEIYLTCGCFEFAHTIKFMYWEEEDRSQNEVYISYHLDTQGFFRRLWRGIKYIFGYKCRYGEFGDTIIYKNQASQLRDFLDKYIESQTKE